MEQVWLELTRTLDQFSHLNQQVREARSRERTARFYKLVNAHHFRDESTDGHEADALELSGGWVILHWISRQRPIRIYPSIIDCRLDLANEGEYLMILDDVSERTTDATKRVSHVDTPLTAGERAILRALRRGLSNKQIAVELGLALSTTKNNLTSVYLKLGADVHSRMEAVILTADWNLEGDQLTDNET